MPPLEPAATYAAPPAPARLIDGFGRTVDYLRVSVTDRCDLRCVYCMSERMRFLPKAQVLSLEELERLCGAFIELGVRRLRITGGEPLVRKDVGTLLERLSVRLRSGALDELTLTTNGTQLAQHAQRLADLGVRRVNVSLDTLDPERFNRLTRGGALAPVLAGIDAAQAAGLTLKLNVVALRGENEREIASMISWAHARGMDLTLIETMPLGEVEGVRTDMYLPLDRVRRELDSFWTLTPLPHRTAGPARYVRVEETGGTLGFITPLTHNFCEGCNRVRLTCTGQLYLCLGQDDASDLRAVLRSEASDGELKAAIREAMTRKPKGHDFDIARAAPAVARHMSMTGG